MLAVVVWNVDVIRLIPVAIVLVLVSLVKVADWMDRRGRK